MLETINFLRNVGQFKAVTDGASLPLKRLTVIYGDNSRGKTTLSEVLRSLAKGNATAIVERQRIDASDPPVVVITLRGEEGGAVFADGAWNIPPLTSLKVFDEQFVAENVCSGLEVHNAHRQALHELILGEQGVSLNRTVQRTNDRLKEHNAELRRLEEQIRNAVPAGLRSSLADRDAIERFCNLTDEPNVDDALHHQRQLQVAAERADEISKAPMPGQLSTAAFDLNEIERVLRRDISDLDADAAKQIADHADKLGEDGERWLDQGTTYLQQSVQADDVATCPFCLQAIGSSVMLAHYRSYFSAAYRDLKSSIRDERTRIDETHGQKAQTAFERTVTKTTERMRFWRELCEVDLIEVDAPAIAGAWDEAYTAIIRHFSTKQAAPLDTLTIDDEARVALTRYDELLAGVTSANRAIERANTTIAAFLDQAASTNAGAIKDEIARLTTVQARYSPNVVDLAAAYLNESAAKSRTNDEQKRASKALADFRNQIFPQYEERLNHHLSRFGTGFRIKSLKPRQTGGPTTTYALEINGRLVPITNQDVPAGEYSFGNTLSAGDRNALAFSMFLVAIELDPNPSDLTVVMDDPISSLDTSRFSVTVSEIAGLLDRVGQVIVLSHNKRFLCDIWEAAGRSYRESRSAIKIVRSSDGSSLRPWDVNNDLITDHDRTYLRLTRYLETDDDDLVAVAKSLRPYLEHYLRVTCPGDFGPGERLGSFIKECKRRVDSENPILSAKQINELDELTTYAHRFHHDSNQQHADERPSDGELRPFVERVLEFARPQQTQISRSPSDGGSAR